MEHPLPIATPTKRELRARCAAYRAGLGAAEYTRRSADIAGRVLALPEVAAARRVHAYWPLVTRREVDTRGLIRALRRQGKEIVLPVVLDFSRPTAGTKRLAHVLLDHEAALRPNRWGIDEPQGGTDVPLETVDVVLVPALALGRDGHRLGHGWGFYDELLTQTEAPSVGLAYAACVLDEVPAEPHDVPVGIIATEHETIRPAPNAPRNKAGGGA